MESLASSGGFFETLLIGSVLTTLFNPALAHAEASKFPPAKTTRVSPVSISSSLRTATPGGVAPKSGTVTVSASAGPVALRTHFDDPLLERLTPPAPGDSTRTPIGGGWRHEFDMVLTRDGEGYAIFDTNGARRDFRPSEQRATRFDGVDAVDGRLDLTGSTTSWRRPDGNAVVFDGSVPVRIEDPDSTTTRLRYAAGRLSRIQRPDGRVLHIHYRSGRLFRISEPGHGDLKLQPQHDGGLHLERRLTSAVSALGIDSAECPAEPDPTGNHEPESEPDPEPQNEPGAEQPCDTSTNPPPSPFTTETSVPGATRIDARPSTCNSYFTDFHGTDRGTAIERGLHGLLHYAAYSPTVRSFPIVDFVGVELRVIRSRDLALPSYNGSGDALFERLLRDGDDIQRQLLQPLERDGTITVTELGETTSLTHDPTRPVVLELLIRHGFASATQQAQIRRARVALRERHGIELRVIEIP